MSTYTGTQTIPPTCENCGRDKSATYICDACVNKPNAATRKLTAERDELRRRLEEVVATLRPSQNPECWDVVRPLYARAVAIAEGRTE